MREAFATVDGVRVCHEAYGDPEDPLVLLVMGLGLDMLWWREDFCRALACRGFRVVRFDNRDVGRSTAFADMADDAAGLVAALRRARTRTTRTSARSSGRLRAARRETAPVRAASWRR